MKRNVIALLLVLCLLLSGCASAQIPSIDDTSKGATTGEISVPDSSGETEDFTTSGSENSLPSASESTETNTSNAENTEPDENSDASSSSDKTQATETKEPAGTTSTSEPSETKPPVTTDEPETSKATEAKPSQTEAPEKSDSPAETTKTPETTESPATSKEPETSTPQETTTTPNVTDPPEETTAPPETTELPETDPPVTTSPYDYPFDPGAVRRECISLASGYGLVLDETLTPDNSCWANPDQASPNTHGTRLKRMLAETIEYYSKDYREANGIYPYEIRSYNIYFEDMGDGTYRIYFLYMM